MNESALVLRHESTADHQVVRSVLLAAFGQAGEADLVDALRQAHALTCSAVAALDGQVVAHVGFSLATINGEHEALALAPVAVAPELQRQGIGAALIRWSLDECRRQGHAIVTVLGDPRYYPRFGFTPASSFGIQCPLPVPPEAFMVLELTPGSASGRQGMIRYRPEFKLV